MEAYEDMVNAIQERNHSLIVEFVKKLQSEGLAAKTIRKHINNISFFLNRYVVYQDKEIDDDKYDIALCSAEDGIYLVDDFLGDWFIRKAVWSDEKSIKSNIASIKKFYKFMHELGLITKDDLKFLNKEIREEKDNWIDTVNRYNDPNEEFDWDFL